MNTQETMYRWRGIQRSGIAQTGSGAINPAKFVEKAFRAHWRELTVETADGTLVGRIEPNVETGRRTWWAENTQGTVHVGSNAQGTVYTRWWEKTGRNGTWFVEEYRQFNAAQDRTTYASVEVPTRELADRVTDLVNGAYRLGRTDQVANTPPAAWRYESDDEIRIGQYVAVNPWAGAEDIGTVESWDGAGWTVRTLTGELTGPWDVTELASQTREASSPNKVDDDDDEVYGDQYGRIDNEEYGTAPWPE